MNFKLMSDLHLEHGSVIWFEPSLEDTLLLAGDIHSDLQQLKEFLHYACDNFKYVLMVAGNHDYYGKDIVDTNKALDAFMSVRSNFRFLNNNSVIIDGIKIIGSTLWSNPAWGVFNRIADSSCITYLNRRLVSADLSNFNAIAKDYIFDAARSYKNKPVIVMTHFGPDQRLMHHKWAAQNLTNTYFWSSGCEYIYEHVNYWMFGHTHDPIIKTIDNCTFVCNPHGYRIPHENFNPDFSLNLN